MQSLQSNLQEFLVDNKNYNWQLIWHLCNIKDNTQLDNCIQQSPSLALMATQHVIAQQNLRTRLSLIEIFSLFDFTTQTSLVCSNLRRWRNYIATLFKQILEIYDNKLSLFDNTCQRQNIPNEYQCTLSIDSYAMSPWLWCINW